MYTVHVCTCVHALYGIPFLQSAQRSGCSPKLRAFAFTPRKMQPLVIQPAPSTDSSQSVTSQQQQQQQVSRMHKPPSYSFGATTPTKTREFQPKTPARTSVKPPVVVTPGWKILDLMEMSNEASNAKTFDECVPTTLQNHIHYNTCTM